MIATSNRSVALYLADLAAITARLSDLAARLGSDLAAQSGGSKSSLEPAPATPSPADLERELSRSFADVDARRAAGTLQSEVLTPERSAQAFADRLKSLLGAQRLTQRELAARLKITPAALSRILKNPERSKVSTLRRIAREMNLSLADVV
jgi:hypothetical protein